MFTVEEFGMPMRVLLLFLLLSLLTLPMLPIRAEEAMPVVATDGSALTVPEDPTPSAPPMRKFVHYGALSIEADNLTAIGGEQLLTANGDVELDFQMNSPFGKLVPVSFTADQLDINPGGITDSLPARRKRPAIMEVRDAILTTCTKRNDHHHFDLRAKRFIVYSARPGQDIQEVLDNPDLDYEARQVAVEVAGHRLLTIPRLCGSVGGDKPEQAKPGVTFGTSNIDGAYLGVACVTPMTVTDDLALNARFGSKEIVRGGLKYSHPISLAEDWGSGSLDLVATWHEDVENRLVSSDELADDRLENLTISRLPALQLSLAEIPLPVKSMRDFTLRLGGGFGYYREDPTGVSDTRGQLWGIVTTPKYRVGLVDLRGEFGTRGAYYGGKDTHRAYVTQISMETPQTSDVYANVSFLRRREAGSSPFLFDRVLIPDELYTEMEFPLGKKSPWRMDIINRHDLSSGKSRDFSVTAIYAQDCLSYGLTYNAASGGLGLGVVINGFGSFRKGIGRISFMQ